MHEYEYINKPEELLTPEVVQMLGTLRECKGRQDLLAEGFIEKVGNGRGSGYQVIAKE